MATVSGNLGLTLPESFDKVDVSVLSNNFTLIDVDLMGKLKSSDVANNLTTTEEGKALDARQGTFLFEQLKNVQTSDEGKIGKDAIADSLDVNDSTKVLSAAQGVQLAALANSKAKIFAVLAELKLSNWTENTDDELYYQSVEAEGVTADANKVSVVVAPSTDRVMEEEYLNCEVRACGQGENVINFSCTSLPEIDLEANAIVIIHGA